MELPDIAGGETAGIPFAALMAERLALPMTYVRKKPKGYGRNARIEGVMGETDRVLLVEDLTTDGGSKLSFVDAIRETGARVLTVVNGGLDLVLPIGSLADLEVNRFGLFLGAGLVLAAVLALTGAARRVLLALLAAGALHVVAFAALLVLQPDYGQTALVTAVWGLMLFLAGISWMWIICFFGCGAVGITKSAHQSGRAVDSFGRCGKKGEECSM
mgnify:CR=1 FL=1